MRETSTSKTQTLICDKCGKREEITGKTSGWYVLTEVETNGLRLFESVKEEKRYESFHIPNKKEMTYCTGTCALVKFKQSMELFLAELKPIKPRSRAHKVIAQ